MPSRDSLSSPTSDVDQPHLVDHRLSAYELSVVTVPNSPTSENKQTQTSSNEQPCPVHPWDYAIPTFPNPLLALQQKPLPNLPTLLELWTLLCDKTLLIPMNAHCELHSPILDLYKLYCFIMGLNDHLRMEKIKRPAESGLVHVLYQLEVLTLMKTLKQAPQKHGRRTFCNRCYQLGQIKKDCRYYQCPHCSLYRPHHNKDQCLEKS